MKFRKPCQLIAEKLKKEGIFRPKFLLFPGRGNFLNRAAWEIARGRFGVIKAKNFGKEIKPGKVLGEVEGVKFLGLRGEEKADAVIVKGRGEIDFSNVEFRYPTVGVDFSLFEKLLPSEKKSLAVQIEIAFGIVKDYFTPENFAVTSLDEEGRSFLQEFFRPKVPFKTVEINSFKNVIVLDPNAEKEFTHEEVDESTLILIGGIVDSSERLKGSTAEILPEVKHRKITYKGQVEIVPDRINEITKIVCQYLTENKSLEEVVRENLTRDSKLRWLRKTLQKEVVKFYNSTGLLRGIPEEKWKKWQEEFGISDFLFRKAAGHVGGFFVFKNSLFDKVKGKTKKRGKEVFVVEEIGDEDVVKVYP
ncbi:tRNA (adenine9-N1/guanine9-N1)-methyltransferase [Desulfurobacterium pacificum]|uniref:tRNA (Adenine9-N1/guanine9-N1)-methyltransferase n=1 Tax=Desulfurobacterium pacificum TaxID=240166 RepID=A0ABY1NN24_9BACT|nr:tRNA (guanine-N1)-methyltransferase [Desulfurobacterium pacificum]SMP13953.1 tRNA (adenine9-N1/guanine9-N1)-methyltransferase [Desulfurobacterium pacificum]